MSQKLIEEIKIAIANMKVKETREAVRIAIGKNITVREIVNEGLFPAMRAVGEKFEKGVYYLPELMVAGKAAGAALEIIKPILNGKRDSFSRGNVLFGTVCGDIHDIGKNIVIMMLKSNGWNVTDLGVDVPPERFVRALKENDYDILAISALLTMTMNNIPEVVAVLEKEGLRDKVKILVGGAPVTEKFAHEIGADGYGEDAWGAVKMAERLIKKVEGIVHANEDGNCQND